MEEQTALDTVYLVSNTNRNVTLEIIIGAVGQTATTRIELNDRVVENNYSGTYPETPLDSNKNLQDKTLFITSTISDTSDESNITEMVIRLRGGVAFREYHLSKEVAENHQSVPYVCQIKFLNV
jgi:hypothetical protein